MPDSEGNVGWVGVLVSATVLMSVALALIYALVAFWPLDSGSTAGDVQYFWWEMPRPSLSAVMFLLVAVAGALGGSIHAVRSLYWYVGNRNFVYSWLLMYFSLPVVGALLAVITYLVLRGGLTSTFASSEDVNPYGFVAVAALVGLFSREAADKLRAIFEAILTPAEAGKDPAIEISIANADPRSGAVGTNVRVMGTGLSSVTSVAIGAISTLVIAKTSDTELAFAVPDGATTGPITVSGPAGSATSSFDFTVR